jgi:hypothetical protein
MSELYGLDEHTLRQRPAEGDWSLKEIAAHMRDAEDLALKQMTAIVERRRATLPAWAPSDARPPSSSGPSPTPTGRPPPGTPSAARYPSAR